MADWWSGAYDNFSSALYRFCALLIGLLGIIVGWKYLNSGTNPFKEHSVIMSFFLEAILVNAVSLIQMKFFNYSRKLSFCIGLVSGIVASELLVFILVTRIWEFIVINVALGLLIALMCFYDKLVPFFSILLSKCFGQTAETPGADEQQEPDAGVELAAEMQPSQGTINHV